MSSTYTPIAAQNTKESLLDGNFLTGAATNSTGADWIMAVFPTPVKVESITIAPFHKDPAYWNPMNGNSGGMVQYSVDGTNFSVLANISYQHMQRQKIYVGGIKAKYWRLYHVTSLGTSCLVFE